jgi:hypothetical protein
MCQLNFELLEQLCITCQWILDNIPQIPDREKLCSLINKSQTLIREIQADEPKILRYQKLADEKKQPQRTDGEVTEPISIKVISMLRGFSAW